jgi:hypothetical protein
MSSALKITTIGDLLKGSPFDPSFHLGGTLTEEVFYKEFFVEPPSMQSFSKTLCDTLDNAFLAHVVTFITGYAGNGKTTFLKTFTRTQPQFEHVYYAAVDWQKGDPGRSRAVDHVMSLMRRNLAGSMSIGRTLELVHANRDALLREDFLSPAFHRFLGEYSESEAAEPSFLEKCEKEFELEDTFAVLFIHLFQQAVPGKKTVVYFDNLDVAPVEYIVSEFWERFQYAITTAERLATDRLFGGRINFRNDFRFVFCLRDTNEALLNAHVADRLDPKHLSYSVPFDDDFYAKVVGRRLEFLEAYHQQKNLLPSGNKFATLVREVLKDGYFHEVYVRLYNCDYRAVTTAVVIVMKDLKTKVRTEVTYGLRGIVLFGLLKQLFDANFLRDYLDHARRKEGWCYIDRVMLTVLMNRSSYRRGIGESDHSRPYGLYNLVQDLKPLYDVKPILNAIVRCFLNHQQGWVHLVTVLNTNVDDRDVDVTVFRLAKLFDEAAKPGNAAARNELNRILIRVNPAGFTLVRFILNHFEFYGHLKSNETSLFEEPLTGERMADGRWVYDFERKIDKVLNLVTEHVTLMRKFFDSHYGGVRVTGEDFPRSPYCFRHQGKARVAAVVGQSHTISLVTSHIDYIDHFRWHLFHGKKPLIADPDEVKRVNDLLCDVLIKYVELLFVAPDEDEATRLAETFLKKIDLIRQKPALMT